MKFGDSLIRLKRFQEKEKRQSVAQIELIIGEFGRMAAELDREIAIEEQRSGIVDIGHFAYSTYARAARVRRDNLKQSTEGLRLQLRAARARHAETVEELAMAVSMEGRDKSGRLEPLLKRFSISLNRTNQQHDLLATLTLPIKSGLQ